MSSSAKNSGTVPNEVVHSFIPRLPLQAVLIVPFVLQIFAVVGLTGYLSLRNGQQAVEKLIVDLQIEIDSRIDQNLISFIKKPPRVNQLNAAALRLQQINLRQLPQLERHFWEQIQAFDEVTQVSIGNELREFVAVERRDDGTLSLLEASESTNFALRSYTVDAQGSRLGLLSSKKNYDPRTRPWYKAAIAQRKPVWSEIFPHFLDPTLIIGASQPIYTPQGKPQGVLLVTLRLAKIGDFLRSLQVGDSGQAFLIERSGHLVATSTAEQPFRKVNQRSTAKIR